MTITDPSRPAPLFVRADGPDKVTGSGRYTAELILQIISQHDKPLTAEQLAGLLGLHDDERQFALPNAWQWFYHHAAKPNVSVANSHLDLKYYSALIRLITPDTQAATLWFLAKNLDGRHLRRFYRLY